MGYAAAAGDVRVGLFLIVPFVYGTGITPALGMFLLMAAAVLYFLGTARGSARAPPPLSEGGMVGEQRATTKHGGIVLVGPIPIVWGSDRRVLRWMIAAGAAMLILALALTWARR